MEGIVARSRALGIEDLTQPLSMNGEGEPESASRSNELEKGCIQEDDIQRGGIPIDLFLNSSGHPQAVTAAGGNSTHP
jgi:hypothetical protein